MKKHFGVRFMLKAVSITAGEKWLLKSDFNYKNYIIKLIIVILVVTLHLCLTTLNDFQKKL
jgi:hypothetical protein